MGSQTSVEMFILRVQDQENQIESVGEISEDSKVHSLFNYNLDHPQLKARVYSMIQKNNTKVTVILMGF